MRSNLGDHGDPARSRRVTFYDPVNDVARGERAILVVPEKWERRSPLSEARLEEAKGLPARSAWRSSHARHFGFARSVRPHCSARAGRGGRELARENEAKLLIVDAALTPVQQKSSRSSQAPR
jgi:hypothetical protein